MYRLAPDGTLHLLVDDFALPNGLAFSPDESVLYIDDSAHKHIRAFDVRRGRHADQRAASCWTWRRRTPACPTASRSTCRATCSAPAPAASGCAAPRGTFLGRVILPELPANLAGGQDCGMRALHHGAHQRLPAADEDARRAAGLTHADLRFPGTHLPAILVNPPRDAATAAADEKALRADAGDAYTIVSRAELGALPNAKPMSGRPLRTPCGDP